MRISLIERARTLLVAKLRDEAGYRQRLFEARAGRFYGLYPIGDVTPLKQNPPIYPRTAPGGASASANLRFTITESSSVGDVEVVNDVPQHFERAAIAAVRIWKCRPVMERGVPVRVGVTVVFEG